MELKVRKVIYILRGVLRAIHLNPHRPEPSKLGRRWKRGVIKLLIVETASRSSLGQSPAMQAGPA